MKKSFLLMGILLTAACVCLAQSQPQSLADLAKQRKPAKKAVLVLSDDDLPPPSSPADDAENVTGPAAAGSAEPAAKANSGKPEATQSQDKDKKETDAPVSKDQRTNELKRKLASYQKEQDAWKKSAKRYEELLANESDDFRRQMYQDALENDKHNTAVYQQKIDEVQSELSKQNSTSDGGNQP